MTMPFYPRDDRQRLSDLWAAAEAAARAVALPSGFDRVYDPGIAFETPALSTNPSAPTLFATWGWRMNPLSDLDPSTAPFRELEVTCRIFCQRAGIQGSSTGYLEITGAEFWRELQGASVSGLHPVPPQSLSWSVLPLFDEEWMEARLEFELMSTP